MASYNSTQRKNDDDLEIRAVRPTLQENRKKAEKELKELQKETRDSLISEDRAGITAQWPIRKMNEREKAYLLEAEKTQRFLNLLYATIFFAGLIYVADFFTFKLGETLEFAWLSYVIFGLAGFFNILYVIRKHDHILWAVKSDCDVSDGTVLYKKFLFLGRQSIKARGTCVVYCAPTTGNNKIYRPFATRFESLRFFKYKSNAVILWVDGVDKPASGFAVKMRY